VSQTDYAEANAEFHAEIESISERLHALSSQRSTLEAFVRFAKLLLVDIAGAWERANSMQKLGVQNFLFFGGISYTEKLGFLNTAHPALYHCRANFCRDRMPDYFGRSCLFAIPLPDGTPPGSRQWLCRLEKSAQRRARHNRCDEIRAFDEC
jgi:hypothetical protein